MLAITVALVYALVSMIEGQMLIFGPTNLASEFLILTGGSPWWNYPGILVIAPNAILALPFFPTLAMVVVSVGVGLGMSVALVLGWGLLRARRTPSRGPVAAGGMAGLTPAMIALVTLGACCSTTAAAAAGVGVVAQTSGTSVGALLANNWYLGVFQIGILWVSLVAQEQLVAVYGAFVARSGTRAAEAELRVPTPNVRAALGLFLRFALLVGGLTWSLAMFAGWIDIAPATAGAAIWFDWLAVHQFLGLLAIAVALSPGGASRLFLGRITGALAIFRGLLLVLALTVVVGTPPPVSMWGIYGLLNEIAGSLGASAAVGGVSPATSSGLGLALHWGFQELALGGLLAALAVAPQSTLDWLRPRAEAPVAPRPIADAVPGDGPRPEGEGRSAPAPFRSTPREPIDG